MNFTGFELSWLDWQIELIIGFLNGQLSEEEYDCFKTYFDKEQFK